MDYEYGKYLQTIIQARARRAETDLEFDIESLKALQELAKLQSKMIDQRADDSKGYGAPDGQDAQSTQSMHAQTLSPDNLRRPDEPSPKMQHHNSGDLNGFDYGQACQASALNQLVAARSSQQAHNTEGNNSLSQWFSDRNSNVVSRVNPRLSKLTERNIERQERCQKSQSYGDNNVFNNEDKSSICSIDQTIPLGNTACSHTRARSVA